MCFDSHDLSWTQQTSLKQVKQTPKSVWSAKNAEFNYEKDCLEVGSRILESNQQSAVRFSQDLNHFSVGSKSSSPTKQH